MKEKRENLIAELESLEEDERQAVIWLIKHHKLATALCRECPNSPEESKALEEEAIAKHDAFLLVLVLFERLVNKKKSPPEKADRG